MKSSSSSSCSSSSEDDEGISLFASASASTHTTSSSNDSISSKKLHVSDFDKSPAWAIIQNKEIKISSTEIRKQREQLRSKD